MSFVTTQPDALEYAAGKLEGIGTSLAAQNTSAAASTTGVAPAAADEVSALQATQFTAYGNLYQQVSAEATAINQAFVQMLGLSGDSYGATEATNSAATGTAGLGGINILGQLTQFGQFGLIPGAMSGGTMDGMFAGGPFLSDASSFLGLLPPADSAGAGADAASAASAGMGNLGGLSLAGAGGPAAVGAAPVLAGVGQASAVGGLSVPQSWAAGGGLSAASATPATVAGWTSPAPHSAPVNTVPGGVPSMVSTGRTSGLGAPRYGIKPKVMPRSTVI
ncbi:PPE family protein, SVP subgroup [Mycobacterium sp.]|uniref:PPE family protein, SVP subgroup n=1 Tax=Mycobacterium sp. TaxID=1785 RepID=UPI003C755BF5